MGSGLRCDVVDFVALPLVLSELSQPTLAPEPLAGSRGGQQAAGGPESETHLRVGHREGRWLAAQNAWLRVASRLAEWLVSGTKP